DYAAQAPDARARCLDEALAMLDAVAPASPPPARPSPAALPAARTANPPGTPAGPSAGGAADPPSTTANPPSTTAAPPAPRPPPHTRWLVPVYPLTKGITQTWLRELVARAVVRWADEIPDFLPDWVVAAERLPPRGFAVRTLHHPWTQAAAELARRRLAFEEL